ncbi:hypothetical protein VB713_11460 [Anabaena cylindrica UHCC 0172]|uniref:hypothetical protein n=1 Tax=Anabaena cylindrica TaxID=1165 RepID=UPI002B212465|nr:hypothetical protein [Anabaena cylindrica]MEA5551588.1 hypothetical protein [Anabaena cylindrica UHCC 0172]
MSNQKLTLKVGLVLILLSSLVVSPLRTNAGQFVVPGTSPDSSGVTGDSFGFGNQGTPGNEGTQSGDGVSVGNDGIINPSPRIQDKLNLTAVNIINSFNKNNLIIILIIGGEGAEDASTKVNTQFVNLGASSATVQELVKNLFRLCFSRIASVPGLPVGKLTPGKSVASTKSLKTVSVIAQADPTSNVDINTANVDINQLNAAISAYNQIVRESNVETLKKLSQDENFQEAGRVLRELRVALK